MRLTSLAKIAAATALICTMSVSATAAPTADGVTTSDMITAMQPGLKVEPDNEKPDLLFAQGKNHTIGVWGTACENGRCKGITYLSVLKVAPSTEAANKYNSAGNFSKIYINSKGAGFLVIDQIVWGGVSSSNILNNALVLMAETTDYLEKSGTIASATPPAPNNASLAARLNDAMGRQWLGNFDRGAPPLRPDVATRNEIKATIAERQWSIRQNKRY